jgi:hypothetical protein
MRRFIVEDRNKGEIVMEGHVDEAGRVDIDRVEESLTFQPKCAIQDLRLTSATLRLDELIPGLDNAELREIEAQVHQQ